MSNTYVKIPSEQPREEYVPVKNARLFCRDVGHGQPLFVLHGGPDFNTDYLLPEMDALSDSLRLIYYDQRGRGRSGVGVQPEDVSIESEVADLEALRVYFQLETVAILGHSWGGLLALEYAIRHPHRVSRLILMNPAPVSHDDLLHLRQERKRKEEGVIEQLKSLSSTKQYNIGNIEADAVYYRVHFQGTLRRAEHLEKVVNSLRLRFTPQGIRKARAIEDRLYRETWASNEYDLLPKLRRLNIPTLVIHGDNDLVPVACAEHIALAMPHARFVLLKECGHFSYLERPHEVHEEITGFLKNN
jgi:proline iminopeptidase